MDLGAKLLAHHSDIMIVKQGWERIQDDFGKIGFTFANSLAAK